MKAVHLMCNFQTTQKNETVGVLTIWVLSCLLVIGDFPVAAYPCSRLPSTENLVDKHKPKDIFIINCDKSA